MKRAHPETDLQTATRNLFVTIFDPANVLFLHVPNGEKRDRITAARLRAMGVLPGASDWLLSWRGPKPPFVGWIELKAGRNGLTAQQIEFRERIAGIGHRHAVCRSIDEVLGVLDAWQVPMRAKVRLSA